MIGWLWAFVFGGRSTCSRAAGPVVRGSRTRPPLPVAIVLAAAPAWAHHAFAAEFDSTKPIKLRGTITKVEFINPHAWIHIDVKDETGKVTSWMIEGGKGTKPLAAHFQIRPDPLAH